MIKIENLCKQYDTNAGSVEALKDINLELPNTGMIFLVGKSGCGKSTLLNILGGIDKPTTGEINVDGNIINSTNGHSLDEYRNRVVGFVFQEFNLLDEYNVYDNVAIALNLRGEKEINNKVAQALDKVGLAGYEKRRTNELSDGQKQRVAIARAIVAESKILLADEPTGNLDSATAKELFDLFRELSKNQLVFIVTHDEENANKYANRIIRISDGKIASDELKNQIEDEYKKQEQSKEIFVEDKKKSFNIVGLTKLGFKNVLKTKWRLMMATILLCFTLTVFGIGIATASYNSAKTTYDTFYKNEVNEIKVNLVDDQDGNIVFQNDKVTELQEKFPDYKFNVFYEPTGNGLLTDMAITISQKKVPYLHIPQTVIDQTILDYYGYYIIVGQLPQEVNEICISKLMADWMIENELLFYKSVPVETYDDILAGEYRMQADYAFIKYKIVGIIETYANDYLDKLTLQASENDFGGTVVIPRFQNSYSYAFMFNKSYFEYIYENAYRKSIPERKACFDYYGIGKQEENVELGIISEKFVNKTFELGDYCKPTNGEHKIKEIVRRNNDNKPLKRNEVMVSTELFRELVFRVAPDANLYDTELVKKLITRNTFYLEYATFNTGPKNLEIVLEVAGVYSSNYKYNKVIISDELNDELTQCNAVAVNTKLNGNKKQDMSLIKELLKPNYTLRAFCTRDLEIAKELTVPLVATIGICTALVLGAITAIMIINVVKTSIKENKKQIGILRTLGMKKGGMIYIFAVEIMMILLLSFIIAVTLTFICSPAVSDYYSNYYYAIIIPTVVPDFVTVLSILAFGIAICAISTLIPVFMETKKMPSKLIKETDNEQCDKK